MPIFGVMHQSGFMKKFLLLLVVLWSLSAYGQRRRFLDDSKDFDFTADYTHWGVTLGGNIYPFESHTDLATGRLSNRYYLMWGFDAGLAYHIRLSNYFGIKLRLTAERAPVYSYLFYVPGAERADGRDYYARVPGKYAPWSFHLPVGLEVRTFAVPRYIFLFRAGVDIGYIPALNYARRYGDHLTLVFAGVPTWQFDPYVAAGWYYRFPWFLWETALVYRTGWGKPYHQGGYAVSGLQQTNDFGGLITQNGSYVGLQFTWYFYRKNRKEGAECAGQVHSRKVLRRQKAERKARQRAEREKRKARKRALKRQRRMQGGKRKKRFILF